MTDAKAMRTDDSNPVQHQAERETILHPAADIYEEAKGITIKADLPGVSRDHLDVQVEGNNLSIEGQMVIDMPDELEAVYADVNANRFRRSFTLSNELDADKITAEMNNGVLTVFLPRRAELQPRKIKISTS